MDSKKPLSAEMLFEILENIYNEIMCWIALLSRLMAML